MPVQPLADLRGPVVQDDMDTAAGTAALRQMVEECDDFSERCRPVIWPVTFSVTMAGAAIRQVVPFLSWSRPPVVACPPPRLFCDEVFGRDGSYPDAGG